MSAFLLDTNIVVHLVDSTSRLHPITSAAIDDLMVRDHAVFLAPQILSEFWVVATRPASANGLDWSPRETRLQVDRLCETFPVLPEMSSTLDRWLDLVTRLEIRGKRAHDVRLLAFMLGHGVSHLLTFNTADFPSIPSLTLLDPQDLA